MSDLEDKIRNATLNFLEAELTGLNDRKTAANRERIRLDNEFNSIEIAAKPIRDELQRRLKKLSDWGTL